MKISAAKKDSRLLVKVKTASNEAVDPKELDRFSRVYLRCFLKPTMTKSNLVEYTGPMGISLKEKLRKPVTKREFLMIMEHVIVAVQKLRSNQFPLYNLNMDMEYIYINETTKELQFLYVPMVQPTGSMSIIDLFYGIINAARPSEEPDTGYVARFHAFFHNLVPFNIDQLEQYIQQEDRTVVNAVKMNNAGQSGYMTNNPGNYYAHMEAQVQNVPDADATGILDENSVAALNIDNTFAPDVFAAPQPTPANFEDATGLLSDYEDATGLLAEEEPVPAYPQFAQEVPANPQFADDATGLLVEEEASNAMPVLEAPVFTPVQQTPVYVPVQETPVMPVQAPPVMAVQEPPAFTGEFRPVMPAQPIPVMPVQDPVANMSFQPAPVFTPEEPAFTPVPEAPVLDPVPEAPIFAPIQEAPVFAPVQEVPVFTPVPETPVYVPAPEAPVFAPAQEAPVFTPAPEMPVFTPAPAAPVMVTDENATGLLVEDEGGTTLLNEESAPQTTVVFPKLYRVITGETISVNKPVFRLGKEQSYVDYFVSNNSAVSRSHADIITRGTNFFVIDLNSKNGTYLNNRAIAVQTETEIRDGDMLRLGNEEFIFRIASNQEAPTHCPGCKAQLESGMKFCPFCGNRIRT